MDFTMAPEISFGAGRPGIAAVVITTSILGRVSAISAACFFL